jgi:tetratricopeptide (TPR) repeat protein
MAKPNKRIAPVSAPPRANRASRREKLTSTAAPKAATRIEEPAPKPAGRERLIALLDRGWIHVALIGAACALVFANTLHNGFHIDDHVLVKGNPGIHQLSRPWQHFIDPTTQSTLPALRGYRPLLPLTLSINYAIAGDSLTGYHLVNLALHIGASWVLYFVILQLLQLAPASSLWPNERRSVRAVALCVALLFALHPISGISVNYICGRDQPLSQLFWGAALLVYLRMCARRFTAAGWLAAFALLTLSLMSKMYAAVAPFVVLWLELTIFQQPITKLRPWLRAGAFLIPIVALHVFQKLVIGYLPEFQNNLTGGGHKLDWSYPLTQARLHLWRYLPNFFWPLPIRQDPWEPAATGIDFKVAAGMLFITGSLLFAWLWRRREPIIAFCIVSYWLMLASTSSIAPLYYLAADYRPYPASPFLFLPLCLLAWRLRPTVRQALAVGAIAWCAATSIYLNTTWLNDVALYTHSVKYGAGWLAYNNLAMATTDIPKRRELLEKSLERGPFYDIAMVNLGRTLIYQGDKKTGMYWLDRVKRLNPTSPLVRYWYARTMIDLGRKDDAAREADVAARLAMTNPLAANQAGLAWQAVNNQERALYWFNVEKTLEPNSRSTDWLRAFGLQQLGRRKEAIEIYKAFLSMNPGHVQARFNLGHALMEENDCPAAIREFERVLELDRSRTAAHFYIGKCAKSVGNAALAQTHQDAWDQSQKPKKN